jgi:hypothetical protein
MNDNSGVAELRKMAASFRPVAEIDPEPSPFVFNTAPDKIGLPMESLRYVKKSCKRCDGRGYQTILVGDGYKMVDDKRVARRARKTLLCFCVHQGYTKTRLGVERSIEQMVELGSKPEDAQVAALAAAGFGPTP